MANDGQTHEDRWDDFWAPIVLNEDGTVNLEQVKRELGDYRFVMGEVARVYDHVTGGLLSKVNYYAEGVISAADEYRDLLIQEACAEERARVLHTAASLIEELAQDEEDRA